jgi:hypothetical protein
MRPVVPTQHAASKLSPKSGGEQAPTRQLVVRAGTDEVATRVIPWITQLGRDVRRYADRNQIVIITDARPNNGCVRLAGFANELAAAQPGGLGPLVGLIAEQPLASDPSVTRGGG